VAVTFDLFGTLVDADRPDDPAGAVARDLRERDVRGRRKPDPRIFETAADRLGVAPQRFVHVGDDERTDGGVRDLGGRYLDVATTPLNDVPTVLSNYEEGG